MASRKTLCLLPCSANWLSFKFTWYLIDKKFFHHNLLCHEVSISFVSSCSIKAIILGTANQGITKAMMKTDGNFVLVDKNMKVKFSSDTSGHPGSKLDFGNACDFRIVSPSGRILWNSTDQCSEFDESI